MQAPQNTLIAVSALALLALTGCDSVKSTLGLEKRAPDEFAVTSRAPLSLPPSFALRPPAPGERRPQDVAQRDQARAALLGVTPASIQSSDPRAVTRADPSGLTAGENALLAKVGPSDPDIRRMVNEEQSVLATDDRGFVERLMFWRSYEAPVNVVDARREQQRIQESSATGKAVTGAGTPVIERKGGSSNKGISIF